MGSAEYNSRLKTAIHEVKDRKKLAKRIIKAIQPQLEIAVRAEADLLQKSPDKMVADLELLLEGCIDISPEALLGPTRHGTADPTVAVQSIEGVDTAADDNVDVNQQISVEAEAADSLAEAADVDMLDEDAPGEIDDGDAFPSITPTEAETATKPTTQGPPAAESSATPPAAASYAVATHHLPQAPTPPVSNPGAGSIVSQDLALMSGVASVVPPGSFLTGGGKPWYLQNYDPNTGTFVEPRVLEPEPEPEPEEPEPEQEQELELELEPEPELEQEEEKATSDEELSEIDDEEMRDLEEGVGEEMGAGKKVETATPKKKAKKRRRAY